MPEPERERKRVKRRTAKDVICSLDLGMHIQLRNDIIFMIAGAKQWMTFARKTQAIA